MREKWLPYLFMLPLIVIIFIFVMYPVLDTIYLSFTNKIIERSEVNFVYLANYWYLLFRSSYFYEALSFSFVYALVPMCIKIVVSIGMALIFNESFKGRKLFRTLFIVPYFIPTIAATMVFQLILNDMVGIMNSILLQTGIVTDPIAWFGNPFWAKVSVIMETSWRAIPFYTLMMLAGLQAIPEELYEAAKVDGASKFRRFRHITIPGLLPIILVASLLTTIWTFNTFDEIWLLTRGGPSTATQTLVTLTYDTGYNAGRLGEAGAVAVIGFSVVLMFLALYIHGRRLAWR